MGLPFRFGPRISYRVETRSSTGAKVIGYFLNKTAAESAMGDYEKSEDYDSWHECLWLVEVAPDGSEKDLYGYT